MLDRRKTSQSESWTTSVSDMLGTWRFALESSGIEWNCRMSEVHGRGGAEGSSGRAEEDSVGIGGTHGGGYSAQLRPIRWVQQLARPPGRLWQWSPPHAPQLAGQHTRWPLSAIPPSGHENECSIAWCLCFRNEEEEKNLSGRPARGQEKKETQVFF